MQQVKISLQQLKVVLSRRAPHACVHARQHQGMLLMRQRVLSWENSIQIWTRVTLTPLESLRCNLTVLDGPKYNMPQMFYWI